MQINKIEFSPEYFRSVAARWGISEIAVFGSVLSDNFGDNSDLDFLITFLDEVEIGLFEISGLREELSRHFARKIDIVEKRALSNPYRKASILQSARVIYEA